MKTKLFILASILILSACSTNDAPLEYEGKPLKLTEISKWIDETGSSYFIFHIDTEATIDRNNLPETFKELIKTHGASQSHSRGSITGCFYYLDKSDAPDISKVSSGLEAMNAAHGKKPIIAIWQNANDRVEVAENPQ